MKMAEASCPSCADEKSDKIIASGKKEFEGKLIIAGQPNCGKTSIFNLLTDSSQYVGNWTGVTVEKKEGILTLKNKKALLVTDTPGTYSIFGHTPDELVTENVLISKAYDILLITVSATTLERQLQFVLEASLINKKKILIITMNDELESQGKTLDLTSLSKSLKMPVAIINGRTGAGLVELKDSIEREIIRDESETQVNVNELASLSNPLSKKLQEEEKRLNIELLAAYKHLTVEHADFTEKELHISAQNVYASSLRFTEKKNTFFEKVTIFLDRLILSKYFGIPIFFLILFAMFQATFTIGDFVFSQIELVLIYLSDLANLIPIPIIASLLSSGIIGGAGNVLALAPYVFIMFLILSFLEDSGYMARTAFIMDRFMHKLGLHGKAFIPLVLGFGCNVPAIMAARTLESPKDRIKVALMIPFTSCSARLPVYALFSAVFFGKYASLVVLSLYLGGVLAGLGTAFLLSKTKLGGKSDDFLMELPPYRLPRIKNLFINTWNKTKGYIQKAGTVIVFASILLWILSYFPSGVEAGSEASFLGMLGKFLAPVFSPLGFDYRMTISLLSGFAAKEVIISTLSIVSGGLDLSSALPLMMNSATSLGYLVFILLYTPCLATVAVMRTETGSTRWTIFSVLYSLFLAYGLSFVVRSIALLFM